MNISFELTDDSVGVNDLALVANRLGFAAKTTAILKLGKNGPKPGLMVTFGATPEEGLVDAIRNELMLVGIEVDHG